MLKGVVKKKDGHFKLLFIFSCVAGAFSGLWPVRATLVGVQGLLIVLCSLVTSRQEGFTSCGMGLVALHHVESSRTRD